MNNVKLSFLFILFILLILFLTYKTLKYKKSTDEKNVQLIQFYLDTKFMCKCLVDSLNISDPISFCTSLMLEIKEYYNLEDIIIIDSIKMISGESNTALRNEIVKYIQDNFQTITAELHDYMLVKFNFEAKHKSHVIYISRILSKDEGDGLIVCVERSPSLLTKQEKRSLENSINLLKNRLLHG